MGPWWDQEEPEPFQMYAQQAQQVPQQQMLPAGHPSLLLRSLRDLIPQVQADDSSTMSGITSRLGRTATAIPRAGLETMANWLQGTHDPNAVRIGEDTIAPLGLFGMAGLAGRGAAASRAMADNAKSSVPGTVVNAMGEGRGRAVADELLGIGTNRDSFEQMWSRIKDDKTLSKADWANMANHFANAPTGATYEWKFKNIDEAKRRVYDVFAERFERESKQAIIKKLTTGPGDAQASPLASSPGLAASASQQPDEATMAILRQYGYVP